jgi:hypothetical protein
VWFKHSVVVAERDFYKRMNKDKTLERIHKNFPFLAMIVVILLLFAPLQQSNANHLLEGEWETPQWIPGLFDTDTTMYPIFIDDGSGTVHVIHTQQMGEQSVIMYSQWVEGIGWTEPVDIYYPPGEDQRARVTSAFLDNSGMLNIIYWGGNDRNASMFFMSAPLRLAGSASDWSAPNLIGQYAISPATAAAVSDGDGWIMLIYSGDRLGNGLYSVWSNDYGDTWSEPEPIFHTYRDTHWPTELKIIQGSNNNYHAVWALGNITGNSSAVYYALFDTDSQEWENTTILAEADANEVDTPSIIEHNQQLILIYHADFPTTRWMRRSYDVGKNWTAPVRLFQQVGSNGPASMVVDSSNTLHMFFGNRISGSPDTHGLWHSIWKDGGWSLPEAVVSGPLMLVGPNGEEGFDPSNAQAFVIRGNQIFLVWRHDPLTGPIRIWYSYSYVNTPQLPVSTIADPVQLPISSDVINDPATITPPPITDFIEDTPSSLSAENLNRMLFTSVLPAFALVLIMAILILLVRK